MLESDQLLTALRFGDSAFPSGSFAFSFGLEGSHRDGLVRDEADVQAFAAEQLDGRWHPCDRVLLRRAWVAADPAEVDDLAEATSTMSVLREASRRAGAATLATFAALLGAEAAPAVDEYRRRVLQQGAPGHLPIAQALCLRAAGLTLETAETVTAWQVIAGISSAAVRLGICGHLGAQRTIASLTPVVLEVLQREPAPGPAVFTVYADVAAQRRGDGVRLFAS